MYELSEVNKKKFHKQVSKISENDETKVKDKISNEIAKLEAIAKKKSLQKLEPLIDNAKLLHNILLDTDFPITDSSRKWIIFGLKYLVSNVDLIPDSIPVIGYSDDNMILLWVVSMIKSDIDRYKHYIDAKDINKNRFKRILQGNGEQLIVFFPGFFESKDKADLDWVKQIRRIYSGSNSPGISIFDWNIDYLSEFINTLPMIDHKLSLRPVYDNELFGIEWQQLKLDLKNMSKHISNELTEVKKENPDKEIIAICLNVGSISVVDAIHSYDSKLIDKLYLIGSTCMEKPLIEATNGKVNKIYNIYSENDHAIKFIFDNFEEQKIPIGLGEFHSQKAPSLNNTNVSKKINSHQDYKYKFNELINNIK